MPSERVAWAVLYKRLYSSPKWEREKGKGKQSNFVKYLGQKKVNAEIFRNQKTEYGNQTASAFSQHSSLFMKTYSQNYSNSFLK